MMPGKKLCETTNPFFAKLIADSGKFDGHWVGGLTNSLYRGYNDDGSCPSICYSELIHNIRQVSTLPIFLDCNNGSDIGLMSIPADYHVIEDTKGAKLNSFEDGDRQLYSIQEFQTLIKNYNSNRRIIARTECLISNGSITETIERCEAYFQVGACAVFVHSKSESFDDVYNVISSLNIPIVLCPTTYNISLEWMKKVEYVIFANQISRYFVKNFNELCSGIVEQTIDHKLASVSQIINFYSNHG
jgi:phosphoenolpyruvate phosphomutase